MRRFTFAIVGAGPAGFYTAKLLSRMPQTPAVHVFEKEICPFGLIRYGVAPDHQAIKRVEYTLSEVAKYPLFKYYGNSPIDIQRLNQLKQMYSGVIFAYGSPGENRLSFDDMTARQFVYWYNGHPSAEDIKLQSIRNVSIVGNGNVAVDVARILLKKPSELASTDISLRALEQLKKQHVKSVTQQLIKVTVIGRRGVAQSSFTVKEIREFKDLDIELCAVEDEVVNSFNENSIVQSTDLSNNKSSMIRVNIRKQKFMSEHFKIYQTAQEIMKSPSRKKLIFRFLLSPESYSEKVLRCRKNRLEGDIFNQEAVPTDQVESISTDLLVSSIGFRSKPMKQQHFDERKGVIRNSHGCVMKSDKVDLGYYTVGWSKTGAKGVIDQTLLECEQTVNNLRIHMENGVLEQKAVPQPKLKNSVSFEQYERIRDEEIRRGKAMGKDRLKMSAREIMQFL